MSQSPGLVTVDRKPESAAGSRTRIRKVAQTTSRTNRLFESYPHRSRTSGTTRNGKRIATKTRATTRKSTIDAERTPSHGMNLSGSLDADGQTFNPASAFRIPGRIRMSQKVTVIGAGEMGHGIAELVALHGYSVSMRDIKQEYLDR